MLVENKDQNNQENQVPIKKGQKKNQESAKAGSYSARRKNPKDNSLKEGIGKKAATTAAKGIANSIAPGVGGRVVDHLANKKQAKDPKENNSIKSNPKGNSSVPVSKNPFSNLGMMPKLPQMGLKPKGQALPPKPNLGNDKSSILDSEEEYSDDETLSDESEDSIGFLKRKRKNKQKTEVSGVFSDELKAIVKKSAPIWIPIVSVGILFLLLCMFILMNINDFGPMLGINTKVGGENGGEEYEAMDAEEDAFYERVKVVHDEYVEDGAAFDAELVGAVFFIMQTYNEELTFDDMNDAAIRKIVEAMFDTSETEDGVVKTYNKDTFTSNLASDVFPSFLSNIPKEQYPSIAEEIFEYIDDYKDLIEYQTPNANEDGVNTLYWWPIGSLATTTELGILFAKGEPTSTEITSYYAGRIDPFTGAVSNHKGMDLVGKNSTAGMENVIAALDGTVVYPAFKSDATCPSFGDKSCGGGYGNYVVIKHADGNFTLYAHMHQNTITVQAGNTVKQGQVIGRMGSSGRSTGTHLHFEVRQGVNMSSATVDPLNYIDPNNPRPVSTGSNWSLEKSSLSKSEFVAKMNDYCSRSGNSAFCTNFASHAESIYDTAHAAGVNPELVVVTAGTEQGWRKSCGYNFYGIGIANGQGCSSGASYSSLEDGIRGYANTLAAYKPGGKHAAAIENRYNQRKAAGCDPAGYGMPGTLQGMQSVYSWLGDYRYNPGSWGKGGCVYLKLMYPNYPYCKASTAATDNKTPTTVCEQSDYTAFQLKQKYQYRNDIFGL